MEWNTIYGEFGRLHPKTGDWFDPPPTHPSSPSSDGVDVGETAFCINGLHLDLVEGIRTLKLTEEEVAKEVTEANKRAICGEYLRR